MARLARIVVPGLAHHVTQHGKATAGLPGAYTISGSTVTSPTCAPYTPSPPMYTMQARYLVDQGGEQVTEMSEGANETWAHSNVWAGGKLVATYDYNNGNGGIHFELTDPLGTKRVQANASGQVDETCTGLPCGNDVGNPISVNCTMASKTANTLGTQDDATEHHFTGKERDAESGNDYFGARYYASSMGRFMSPDPAGMMAADIEFPQSLNRYAYVWNNPLSFTDPTGLDCAYLNSSGSYDHMSQTISARDCGKSGGYWVNGGLTNVSIDSKNNTITLTGTTNGSDTTTSTSQIGTTADVGWFVNMPQVNPAGHIAVGIGGGPMWGLGPRSPFNFAVAGLGNRAYRVVPGKVEQQKGGQLKQMVHVPITGPQAALLQQQ